MNSGHSGRQHSFVQGIVLFFVKWMKLLGRLLEWAAGKAKARAASHRLANDAEPVRLRPELVRELFQDWKDVKAGDNGYAGEGANVGAADRIAGGSGVGTAETFEASNAGVTDATVELETVGATDNTAVAANVGATDATVVAANDGAADETIGAVIAGAAPADEQEGANHFSARNGIRTMQWSGEERSLLYRVEHETDLANRNNVTRTEAYRAIYFRRPELHWALLAHVISRNGGWNMTDLKGELLPRLFSKERIEATFRLLERSNALIFSDAYPQLLLYEAGRRMGRDYSHLIRAFGVSRFMEPVWAQFWKRTDPAVLTAALIVNEQHFIEQCVIQHPEYREHVLGTLSFRLQAPMQTNAVVMPYGAPSEEGMKLAGLVLENFSDLDERIGLGKRLYAILFGIPEVKEGVHAFVRAVHHSGSRADYAPHLFTKWPDVCGSGRRKYEQRLQGARLLPEAKPLYSPELEKVWPDVPAEPAESGDWTAWHGDVERYFQELPIPPVFEATDEHLLGWNKIELAVIGAEHLGISGEI